MAMDESELVDQLAGAMAVSTKDGLTELAGMVIALRRRIDRLEARAVPKYRGVWHSNGVFAEGSMCTHDGSVWHANTATQSKPGTSDEWTLCVKRGKDGRNLMPKVSVR